ncbi:unnamed protein product, partial [Mycena citricolor]
SFFFRSLNRPVIPARLFRRANRPMLPSLRIITLALETVLLKDMLSVLAFNRALLNKLAARDFFFGIGTCWPLAGDATGLSVVDAADRVAFLITAGVFGVGLTTLALMLSSLSSPPPSSSSPTPTSSLSARLALNDSARRKRPLRPLPLAIGAAASRVANKDSEDSASDESSREIRRSARTDGAREEVLGLGVGRVTAPCDSGLGRATFC